MSFTRTSQRKTWFLVLFAVLALLALTAAACGDDEEESTPTSTATTPAATRTPAPTASAATLAPSGTPAAATPAVAAGPLGVDMGDNFFQFQGKKAPNIPASAGKEMTVNLKNNGGSAHNMRIAGIDGKYDTQDDFASDPELVKRGGEAILKFKIDKAGSYKFRCDFHPDDMTGTLTVQ